MKKIVFSLCFLLLVALPAPFAQAQNGTLLNIEETFTATVLTDGLDAPWEMLWGPDNMLWVTERHGKRITRVEPTSGDKQVLLTIEDAFVGPQHEGILGMAFGPGMAAKKGKVYVVYTYREKQDDPATEFERVVRFDWDGSALKNQATIIEGIPAGDDHNGGRLLFGPDGKLYLSKGELGHNQFGNACKPIEAQRLPTAQELKNKNYAAYVGKVLRMNADGGIPSDNPTIKGVRSHIFTYGHRNPQGLVFVGKDLYSSEQGPSTDDEINRLVAGGNYGWPHVAGFRDDNAYRYANYSEAPNCASLKFDANVIPKGVPIQKETDWSAPDFVPPVKTFYTVRDDYNFTDARCGGENYPCWPTIAPASITYYPSDGPIPGWGNSLLVTSLKNGTVYRLPLSDDKKQIQGDVKTYFHSPNRYRVARVSPDGRTVYLATDTGGPVFDYNGKLTHTMQNPGAIIRIDYK